MTEDKHDKIEIVGTHEAYAGWTKLLVATVRLPDGRTIKREIEDHGNGVCVLPYHPIRKTAVLVQQARLPVLYAAGGQQTLEAIAGMIEDRDAEACVHREVMEEALLKLDSLEHVFTAWTMPGLSTELMHFYLAVYSGEARPEIRGGAVGEDEDHDRRRDRPCRFSADGGRQCAARRQDPGAGADAAPAPARFILTVPAWNKPRSVPIVNTRRIRVGFGECYNAIGSRPAIFRN